MVRVLYGLEESLVSPRIIPSRRVVVAWQGEEAEVALHIDSSEAVELHLVIENLPIYVARYSLSPVKGRAPFTSILKLRVSHEAIGVYSFTVEARDNIGDIRGAAEIVLIILPRGFPRQLINHLGIITKLYNMYGIQYVIWYTLSHILPGEGLSFTQIKTIYELLQRKRLSNGTTGDLLRRMTRKGIIEKKKGKYYAVLKDEKLVLQTIDTKRVKAGRKGAEQLINNTRTKYVEEYKTPLPVKRILRIAKKLIKKKQVNKALGLIQHTLVGVRKTGLWLIWIGDIFIYWERKAKPNYHYFRSKKLAEILRNMRVKQGFIHAQQSEKLIHNTFPGGYREARRIHYLLKRIGWISYGPPLILYIALYPDGTGGFKLTRTTGEVIASVNYSSEKAERIIKNIVMPAEHADEYNDNTYFNYR